MTVVQNQISRIGGIAQKWFLSEPLLFAIWMTHHVTPNSQIDTIRTGRGRIEFNEQFLASVDDKTLQEIMKFEALRITLKHPYERRKPNAEYAWDASNLAIHECMPTSLPMATAESKFGVSSHNRKHYEFYYNLLCGRVTQPRPPSDQTSNRTNDASTDNDAEASHEDACESEQSEADGCDQEINDAESCAEDSTSCASPKDNGTPPCSGDGHGSTDGNNNGSDRASTDEGDLGNEFPEANGDQRPRNEPVSVAEFCRAEAVGVQNANEWGYDEFLCEQLNDVVDDIQSSNNWGSIAGKSREQILASRQPKLDYRRVLSAFRATVLATSRRLTRMKPSRRYGFEYMGSRRDFTTSILFAIDVSGSVSTGDVENAFSIVNRVFKYGIESIDVIWFDTAVRNEKTITLRKAKTEIRIDGRGGTNFQPLMAYLDLHMDYDGMVVFTDGIAPVPNPPRRNRRTRVVWLFNNEGNWKSMHNELELPGMKSAFVMPE